MQASKRERYSHMNSVLLTFSFLWYFVFFYFFLCVAFFFCKNNKIRMSDLLKMQVHIYIENTRIHLIIMINSIFAFSDEI